MKFGRRRSDIDDDIIRLDIRCYDLEVWVRRSTRIGLHERVIAWQTREEVSRRLAPAQAGALHEHGIDPSSIPVGRVVAMCLHLGIFLRPLSTAAVHFLAGAMPEVDISPTARLMLKRYERWRRAPREADERALAGDHDPP